MSFYTKDELKEKLKNKTNATKIITNKIKTIEHNKEFDDKLIKSILQFHPNKEKKDVNNILYLIIKNRPPFNKPSLYIKTINNNLDDISYKQCIDTIFEKFDKNLYDYNHIISAFRNAIGTTKKKDFYINNKKICSLCSNLEHIEVDHYPIPFSKILDDFIKDNNIIINTLKYIELDNIIELQDKNIKNDFIEYHDKIVNFRFLCRTCNSKNGCNTYIPINTFKSSIH
jgi:hypothetical protein